MKKRIYVMEIAFAVFVTLAGISVPGGRIVSYAGSGEGSCFYFDRMSGQEEQGDTAEEKVENKDRVPEEEAGVIHWKIGDTVMRQIGKEQYRFRCIDQNYVDSEGNHRQAALFLCDTVIPANVDSRYVFEELEDGSHGYVFYSGPVVDFGDTSEYKYSRVRAWLQEAAQASEEQFSAAVEVHTGISRAYTGSTQEGMYSQLDSFSLQPCAIGSQKMTDQLFVLSVDEALKYREWLWKFEGSAEENPQTQVEEYCKGYWLRNPAGTAGNVARDQVYVVDLVHGNLHPAAIRPQTEGEAEYDEEIKRTVIYGIRPAFALFQDMVSIAEKE